MKPQLLSILDVSMFPEINPHNNVPVIFQAFLENGIPEKPEMIVLQMQKARFSIHSVT